MNVQFKKGVLELCVLVLATNTDRYGYELVSAISQKFKIAEGTIYPLLRRLTKEGYFSTYPVESREGPPRKYYCLTEQGKSYAQELIQEGIAASDMNGSVNLQTSNGKMTLENITGSVTANDSNGAISASSTIKGKWSLRTTNARISLSVPSNTNARIHASTSNASIGGNVPWNANVSGQSISTLGTGSNQVHLQTSNGHISVNDVH